MSGRAARREFEEEIAVEAPKGAKVDPAWEIFDAVILHEQESIGGHEAHPLTVNGRNVYVPREQVVALRRPFVGCLGDAIETKFIKDAQGNDVPKHMLRLHFEVLKRDLSPEEVAYITEHKRMP